jgi:hypothetical protein
MKVLALLALSFLIPTLAAAGEAPARATAAVQEVALAVTPNDEEYNELRQSVARLADGSYASVWIEHEGSLRARMQWVRPDGSPLFAGGGRAITNIGADESNAVVVSNPAGGAFVALASKTEDGAQILVQSFDADGNPSWRGDGVFAAAPGIGDLQIEPQLIPAPQGGVFLCFQSFHSIGVAGSDNEGADIVCQHLGADGQRLWAASGVRAGGRRGYRELPKVVRDNGSGLLVFWRNGGPSRPDPKAHCLIEGQHLGANGTPRWGAQGRIVRSMILPANVGYLYTALGAASDGQGGAVVSFEDGPTNLRSDVFAQRVTGDGRLLWHTGTPVATGAVYQGHDSITAAPDGGAFIAVRTGARLLLHRLGPDGKVLWKQQLSSTDSDANPVDWGSYGSFDDGRLRIAWIHQRQSGTWTMDAYLAILDLAGNRLNGPAATPLTTAADGQFLRGFAFDPERNQGFAVWEDRRKGTWDDLDLYGGLYRE